MACKFYTITNLDDVTPGVAWTEIADRISDLTITRMFESYEPVYFLWSTDIDSGNWKTQDIDYLGGKNC